MPKAFSVSQAQRLDSLAIENLGIPPMVLMENAGRQTVQEILKISPKKKLKRVCIFCGCGNNGGDGFVIARYLFNVGIKVNVFLIGKPQNLKKEPAIQYHILKKIKCPVSVINGVNRRVLVDLNRADVLVDAIFGIGLSRSIGEPFRSIIDAMNQSKKIIVSVDAPSGLDATMGRMLGACIKADMTVTFAVMKKGFLKNDGPCYVGKVIVADIGIPKILVKRIEGKNRE